MAFSPDAVANEFIKLAESSGGITPMKLQKLAFFAHGWHLALADEPLLRAPIQAWKFGPVVVPLYHEFKEFGKGRITRRAHELKTSRNENGNLNLQVFEPSLDDEGDDSGFARALVSKVWELYKGYTPAQLSNMTHAEGTPWHTVAKVFNFNLPRGVSIPNEVIAQYFKSRLATPTGAEG